MDRTNMFFLFVAGGAAWFIFREYQKQKAAQQLMFAERAQLSGYDYGRVKDYADTIKSGYY